MAVGQVVVIPNNNHVQEFVPQGGYSYPTVAILNPNDGILFVGQNRDVTNINYGSWEYKVPSQSYALLPGPFQSVGMFYLDQSGAGRQGEIIIYPTLDKLSYPIFNAIGRALVAQESSLDITEGTLPANPGAGILRLWADGLNKLHALGPSGADATVIDTLTALSGGLSGFLPSPALSAPFTSYAVAVSQAALLTLAAPTAIYSQVDKQVTVYVYATINSAGTVGNSFNMTLPVTADFSFPQYVPVGDFFYLRSGTNFNSGVATLISNSVVQFWLGGTTPNTFGVSPSFAAGVNDVLGVRLHYKAV